MLNIILCTQIVIIILKKDEYVCYIADCIEHIQQKTNSFTGVTIHPMATK